MILAAATGYGDLPHNSEATASSLTSFSRLDKSVTVEFMSLADERAPLQREALQTFFLLVLGGILQLLAVASIRYMQKPNGQERSPFGTKLGKQQLPQSIILQDIRSGRSSKPLSKGNRNAMIALLLQPFGEAFCTEVGRCG